MAKVPINDSKHWRKRAEEARTVADKLTDDVKLRMLRIADDYEELARRAEGRLKQQQQQQQPKIQTDVLPGARSRTTSEFPSAVSILRKKEAPRERGSSDRRNVEREKPNDRRE